MVGVSGNGISIDFQGCFGLSPELGSMFPTLTSIPGASRTKSLYFPGGVSDPPVVNKGILISLWLPGVSVSVELVAHHSNSTRCLLGVRLSQQIHTGEQRENKHIDLEIA